MSKKLKHSTIETLKNLGKLVKVSVSSDGSGYNRVFLRMENGCAIRIYNPDLRAAGRADNDIDLWTVEVWKLSRKYPGYYERYTDNPVTLGYSVYGSERLVVRIAKLVSILSL